MRKWCANGYCISFRRFWFARHYKELTWFCRAHDWQCTSVSSQNTFWERTNHFSAEYLDISAAGQDHWSCGLSECQILHPAPIWGLLWILFKDSNDDFRETVFVLNDDFSSRQQTYHVGGCTAFRVEKICCMACICFLGFSGHVLVG